MNTMKNQISASAYWHSTIDSIHRVDPYFGRCIADYCQNHRPEPALLKWIAEKLHGDNLPGSSPKKSIQTIVRNLQNNHLYYRELALPRIGQSFALVLKHHTPSLSLHLCQKLFDLFATSLIKHINEEEQLFNAILESENSDAVDPHLFDDDHPDETQALDQIIDLLETEVQSSQFDPGSILLIQLRNLANDLKIHTFVEEQLLATALKG